MQNDTQTPIAARVSIPAGETRQYSYRSDGGEYINLLEIVTDTNGVVIADVRINRSQNDVSLFRTPSDGEDDAADDLLTPATSTYPLVVPTDSGRGRFTTLQPLDSDERITFKIKNTDTSAHSVSFKAAAASTLRSAIGGGV